jgi:hypothetical protein
MRTRRPRPAPATPSAFAGFRFPPDVIVMAVRWYLRFGLSYRDVEELLAERGMEVDHVTAYRWVPRFTPLLAEVVRPCRHAVGDRWFVDETYVKVAGQWRYVYRAIDQFSQVIDVSSPCGVTRWRPTGSSSGPSVRRRRRLSDGARGIATRGVAPNPRRGTEPKQYANNRSRPTMPAEGAAATNAGAQAGRQRQGDHRWACLRPEPPARSPRASRRGAGGSARGDRLR